ncbi:hypothetical protein F4823DRAFT_593601 [Ustulina deusta]|nr:hypothetical protein F4823DRAFT_593601 [Ustulina deusta]
MIFDSRYSPCFCASASTFAVIFWIAARAALSFALRNPPGLRATPSQATPSQATLERANHPNHPNISLLNNATAINLQDLFLPSFSPQLTPFYLLKWQFLTIKGA